MARFNPFKTNFVAGEISPRLEGRDDLDQYYQGMRQTRNGIPMPHGGFMRRSGTRFVAEVGDSSDEVRLIPFVVSEGAAYILELGDEYMRFFTNSAPVMSGGSPVEISTPWLNEDLAALQYAQTGNFLYLVAPGTPPYRLERTGATSFLLAPVAWSGGRAPVQTTNTDLSNTVTSSGAGPFTLTWVSNPKPGGLSSDDVGRAVRITDGTETDWYKITSVASAKVASATRESGTGSRITSAESEWNLGQFSDTEGCRAIAFHEARLCFGGFVAEPSKIALSVSDDFENFRLGDAEADDAFSRPLVGQGSANQVEWMVSANEKLVVGTSGNEFVLRGDNNDKLTPTGTRSIAVSSRGGKNIQPVVVDNQATFVQRGGLKLRNFQFDLAQDSLIARDLSILAEHLLRQSPAVLLSYQQDPWSVVWVVRENGGLVGWTLENEQQVIAAHRHTIGGSFRAGPAQVRSVATIPGPDGFQGDQTWLVVRREIEGVWLRHIEFMEQQFSPDASIDQTLNEEALIRGVEEGFFVDSGLSLNSPIEVTAVTYSTINTTTTVTVTTSSAHGLTTSDTVRFRDLRGVQGMNFTSRPVASVPSATQITVEYPAGQISKPYRQGGAVYREIDTVSGLDHLEGETVDILADGATHPPKVVQSGSVTLDRKASIVHVGLPFVFEGETQRFVAQLNVGTSQGQKARIQRVVMRLHNTVGLLVGQGPNPDRLERILFRSSSAPMSLANPAFSGDKEVPVPGGWTTEPTIFFRQDQPLPATILAIAPRMEANER